MQFKKMYYFKQILILSCFIVAMLPLISNAMEYKTYYNEKFKYSIDYPSTLIVSTKDKLNDSGQTFISSDEQVKLVIWGAVYPTNVKEGYRAELEADKQLPDYKILYTTTKENYYIISGLDTKNNKYFYMKSLYGSNGNINFYIEYPSVDKAEWNKILPMMDKSLKYTNK